VRSTVAETKTISLTAPTTVVKSTTAVFTPVP
jgi:hypothetical protein